MGLSDSEILMPASAADAVDAFGDGRDVTVFAGGTILMPMLAYGRYPQAARTLMLARAGLSGISDNGTVRIGAMTTLAALADSGIEPLAAAAHDVADVEIRGQATVGGNLCAPPSQDSPRGDLQAALLALGAQVRCAAAGGERTEPVEDFLAGRQSEPRLVLAVEFARPRRASWLSQRRLHAHSYAVMAVACTELADGVRVAAAGVGPAAVRLRSVEQALAEGAAPGKAAGGALDSLEPPDDALASSWYRSQVLPVLVSRAITQLQGG
ncbi:MAG: FAD binding domain-containing protein [Solirubrobacterales bacterium]|nr:FAD binding domain-containing protein [Solirubrobacterales bacterium]